MSLENNFDNDEFGCGVEIEFEDENIRAFPGTLILDPHSPSSTDLFCPQDPLSLGQLGGFELFEDHHPTTAKHQGDSGMSQTISTDEDLASSSGFTASEEIWISYNSGEEQNNSSIRAPFEKIINGEEPFESSSSSSHDVVVLDRDPSELIRSVNNFDKPFQFEFQQKVIENESDDMEKSPTLNSFQTPSPRIHPKVSSRKKVEVSKTKEKLDQNRKAKNSKRPNNRQSQFKNVYSLVEEHARRILSDWSKLTTEEISQIKDEESNSICKEQDYEIKNLFEQFENTIQYFNVHKKARKNCDSERSEKNNRLDLRKKKNQQTELLNKLKLKRFSLISLLPILINDTTNAFLKKSELKPCLGNKPDSRTLTCMKAFLKENIRFGLIVSRIAVEILPYSLELDQLSKSAVAFMYWQVKSPMQAKKRGLFKNQDTRDHIRGVLKDVYLEIEETARQNLSMQQMQLFEDCFNELDQLKRDAWSCDNGEHKLIDEFGYQMNDNGKRINSSELYNETLQKKTKRN